MFLSLHPIIALHLFIYLFMYLFIFATSKLFLNVTPDILLIENLLNLRYLSLICFFLWLPELLQYRASSFHLCYLLPTRTL